MKVDCYNVLYVDVGNLCAGETFWANDILYLRLGAIYPILKCDGTDARCTDKVYGARLDTGAIRVFDFTDTVVRASTKVVCDD